VTEGTVAARAAAAQTAPFRSLPRRRQIPLWVAW
jgi:hypothetical protein